MSEAVPDKVDKIRFGIGNDSELRSSLWIASHHKSDFYIGVYRQTGTLKISLHESGKCRLALDKRFYETLSSQGIPVPKDRAFTKWQRKQTPETGACHVLSLLYPTDFLRLKHEFPRLNKPIFLFKPAPEGQVVEIGFFYSKEPPGTLEGKLMKIGRPMFCTNLPNGEFVSLVARNTPFDPTSIPELSKWKNIRPLGKDALPKPGEELTNLSSLLWNAPKDGEALRVIQISGLTVKNNAQS